LRCAREAQAIDTWQFSGTEFCSVRVPVEVPVGVLPSKKCGVTVPAYWQEGKSLPTHA